MKNTIGNMNSFAIEYEFFEQTRETEISMYVEGRNLLAFEKDNQILTTRWDIEELALWLRDFIDNMVEDPYPVQVVGDFAAEKDINAREFDSDDEKMFDEYYDKLYEWNSHHRWHPACGGAILSDIYFELIGECVDISWNNTDAEDGVKFCETLGHLMIDREEFINVIDEFLNIYADQWYPED